MIFFTTYTLFEMAALVTTLFFLRSYPWAWHRWFLALVLLAEMAGITISKYSHQPNHWLYNGLIPVHFSFISWFLFTRLNVLKAHSRRLLAAWLLLFAAYWFYESGQAGFKQFSATSMKIMELGLVAACGYYYFLLLGDQKTDLKRLKPDLYWVHGVFFFYFVRIVFDVFLPRLLLYPYQIAGIYVSVLVNALLNSIFYSLWTCSFYLFYRTKKK